MAALSELFDTTRLVLPVLAAARPEGEVALGGKHLSVVTLTPLAGRDLARKLRVPAWAMRNLPTLVGELRRADAVHAPVPGDIGTVGMLLALLLRKPLFVRHCGNWFVRETVAEHFWPWCMGKVGGGRNVMLATGGSATPPSAGNAANRWIFSTSLTERELASYRLLRHAPRDGTLRLVIASRQDREKGTGVLVESLPAIRREFPRVSLDVAGDGPHLAEFTALAARLGVQDIVRFHGRLNHDGVMRLLHQADLFCYPTRASEGFPKVVLEALACGLPVITTRVSVLPELIGRGGGRLIEDVTPAAMARAVIDSVNDPDAFSAMSAQAIATAQGYSLERWRDTLGEWLEAAWGPLQSRA